MLCYIFGSYIYRICQWTMNHHQVPDHHQVVKAVHLVFQAHRNLVVVCYPVRLVKVVAAKAVVQVFHLHHNQAHLVKAVAANQATALTR